MVLLSRLCKSDEQLTGVISLYLHNTYSYTTLQQHNTWIQRYLCMHSVCTFFHLFLYVFIFWLRKNMKIETNTREDFEKQNVFLDESNKSLNSRIGPLHSSWSTGLVQIIFLSVSRLGLDKFLYFYFPCLIGTLTWRFLTRIFLLLFSLCFLNSDLKIDF